MEDIEEATRFREMVQETFRIGGATIVGDFLPALKLLVRKWEKSLVMLQQNRDEFMQGLIKDCRKRMEKEGTVTDSEIEGKKKSLIEVLLTLQEKEPEYYKDEIIRSLMLVSYFNSALILNFALTRNKPASSSYWTHLIRFIATAQERVKPCATKRITTTDFLGVFQKKIN